MSSTASTAPCVWASVPTASMQRSGPRPRVSSCSRSYTSSSSMKSTTSALPTLSASRSRSGTRSMAMTRPAPSIQALWMANCPTGPQPHTATVSPGSMSAFSAAM